MAAHALDEVISKTLAGGVPCAQIYSIKNIFGDPQYEARENLLHVRDPRVGDLVLPAAVPKLSETPAQFRHAGRALGADNRDIYESLLGFRQDEVQSFAQSGVI